MQAVGTRPLKEFAVSKGLVGGPFGSKLGKADYTESGIPVIRGQNLSGIGFFSSREFVYVSEEKVNRDLSRNLALPNDVVFTQRGTLGQVGIVPSEPYERYVISQSQMRMRVNGDCADARYIYYCFRDSAMVARIHARAITTGVPHINLGILADLPIPDHPLSVQQAIAEVLGALDDKIAVNQRIAETALALAEALYVRDSTNEQGWHEVALADTAKWMSGGTPKTSEPSYWGGDIPWISAASLKSPWLDDSERRVTQFGAENGTRLVPAGTIVFVVRGMSLTSEFRVGLTQREVAFGQDCKALVPHPGIDPVVLLVALRSKTREILDLVDTAGHGTGRLGTDRIAKLRVMLPNGEAGAAFTETVNSLARRASAVRRENRTLADLRNTLLPQLITGKIRVKDAVHVVEDVA
jgi:type I restriction enzyme S subunit